MRSIVVRSESGWNSLVRQVKDNPIFVILRSFFLRKRNAYEDQGNVFSLLCLLQRGCERGLGEEESYGGWKESSYWSLNLSSILWFYYLFLVLWTAAVLLITLCISEYMTGECRMVFDLWLGNCGGKKKKRTDFVNSKLIICLCDYFSFWCNVIYCLGKDLESCTLFNTSEGHCELEGYFVFFNEILLGML